jgi:hypothetical protein
LPTTISIADLDKLSKARENHATVGDLKTALCRSAYLIVRQRVQRREFIMIPLEIALGLGFVATMFAWVGLAMCKQRPPADPADPNPATAPDPKWIRAAYSAGTSLNIEIDREIWQVSTIFTAASLVILGWVVTSLSQLQLLVIVLAGCASILLVTVATLFKHRLRNMNLVHIQHLRSLERAGAVPGDPEYWGVYHRRRALRARGPLLWLTSIHGVMDLYVFAFAGLWVALWFYRAWGIA